MGRGDLTNQQWARLEPLLLKGIKSGHAAGEERQREEPGGVAVEPADHALGRSRSGLSCKLHLAVVVAGGHRRAAE